MQHPNLHPSETPAVLCSISVHPCTHVNHNSDVALHQAAKSTRTHVQVLFGGEIDPSDKGHAGAGQFSNDTYCYDPSKVHSRSDPQPQP